MGYAAALEKAWDNIPSSGNTEKIPVKLLGEIYNVDTVGKRILSASRNVPAKEYTAILILHYLAGKALSAGATAPSGEWIDFNQLEGGAEYYPTFRRRTIERIIKKYGTEPLRLSEAVNRFPSKTVERGDAGIVLYPFEDVPIMMVIWRADEEFAPDANILFDKTIKYLFCTEDVVVLTEFVVHSL